MEDGEDGEDGEEEDGGGEILYGGTIDGREENGNGVEITVYFLRMVFVNMPAKTIIVWNVKIALLTV